MPTLAAGYLRFNVKDTGIRSVSWDPSSLPEGVQLTVLVRRTSDSKWIRPDGQESGLVCTYRPTTMTNRTEFDQIAVVIGNGTWGGTKTNYNPDDLELVFHRGCDWPDRITGSSTMTYDYNGDPGFKVVPATEHQVTTVIWDEPYDGIGNLPGEPMDNATYIDGTVKITAHITGTVWAGTDSACNYEIDRTISLSGIDYQMYLKWKTDKQLEIFQPGYSTDLHTSDCNGVTWPLRAGVFPESILDIGHGQLTEFSASKTGTGAYPGSTYTEVAKAAAVYDKAS